MKKTILKTLVLFFLITTIFSCKDDDISIPTPDNGNYFLKVKIDGVDFLGSDALVITSPDTTAFYSISGADANGNRITLNLNSPTSEGTFIIVAGNDFPSFSYQQISPVVLWGAIDGVGSGTITITKNNATYMEGTFSFIGINVADGSEVEFTEGSFKAEKI